MTANPATTKKQPSDLCVGSKGLREAETPATGTHHVLSALLPSIDAGDSTRERSVDGAGVLDAVFVGVSGSVFRTVHRTHKGGNRLVLYSRVGARMAADLYRHRC